MLVIINNYIEVTTQLGNKFDSNYINALNRATASENVYLKSGTIISLKDSPKYNYGIIKQDSKTITIGTNYLTGGWTGENYTVTTDGWYGITVKRVDNSDIDLGGNDPNILAEYITVE